MNKIRLIPVVLLRNGVIVQSKGFKRYQVLGNPSSIVCRLSNWFSDELIYLDISKTPNYDLRRDDLNYSNHDNILEILKEISRKCFMPLTFGGRITSVKDIYDRLVLGADKISINSQAFKTPNLIEKGAKEFGSQCIVVSIDAKKKENFSWEVFVDGGKTSTGVCPIKWAIDAQNRGAGEILINSIDNDGMGNGYDFDLIQSISDEITIPAIALGGVGEWSHFEEGIKAGVNAVAAANIFHYTENSVYNAKKYLFSKGYSVRKPIIETIVTEGDL